AGSPARHKAGPLPDAGRWLRLAVPAAAVGLEGKTLHGMAFKLHGGQCFWGRAGTVRAEGPVLVVSKAFPMRRAGDGVWSGRFPLAGQGRFRAELRNSPGRPNQTMKEVSYVALPDQPPQVVLERPGRDVTLSKPAAVPLTVAAFDDYGLAEVSL